MVRRGSSPLLWFMLGLAGFVANAESGYACSCVSRPTVLEGFDGSGTVVIARVTGFETTDKGDEFEFRDGIRSVNLVAETVFKGNLKVGGTMSVPQGQSVDCRRAFHRDEKDERFLLYLPGSRKEDLGAPSFCLRSTFVEHAAADLLYLNNIRKRRGQTRIYGTLLPDPDFQGDLAGWTVHITGKKGRADVVTDKDGVFEVYDLPPGDYRVSLDGRAGWKMRRSFLSGPDASKDDPSSGPLITLPAGKDAEVDIALAPDNAVRGSVRDSAGAPLKNVRVDLEPVEREGYPLPSSLFIPFAISNDRGTFSIESVPEGAYIIAVSPETRLGGSQPFERFYYPNLSDRNLATVFVIKPGVKHDDLQIRPAATAETAPDEGPALRFR